MCARYRRSIGEAMHPMRPDFLALAKHMAFNPPPLAFVVSCCMSAAAMQGSTCASACKVQGCAPGR